MPQTPPTPTSPPVYYPVFLNLQGRRVVVVGGGQIALDKIGGLLGTGAQITVIAPEALPLPAGVEWLARPYQPGDLAGATLVIAATDDEALNRQIAREAEANGQMINVVDRPEACSVIMPAVVRRGALCLAISTGGASPLLAGQLRRQLEASFGPEWGQLTDLLWRLRQAWNPQAKQARISYDYRRQVWECVLGLPLLDLLREHSEEAAYQAAMIVLESALITPEAQASRS